MRTLASKTIAYRKCKSVYQHLINSKIEEIRQNELRRLISKYCAASPKMIEEYSKKFVEYNFLVLHPKKLGVYRVNQEKIFSSDEEQECKNFRSSTIKRRLSQGNLKLNTLKSSCPTTKLNGIDQQSKTMVYSAEGEKKVTCSFKGYKSIWKPFKEAVWADGFPDVCYVEHIFHTAYLSASRSKVSRIDVPFTIGDMNFYITINAPYIVERPRRKIRFLKGEIIEE